MEVLDKIKKVFIELPIWLQQGVVAWNKTFIEFENGTRIMTSATNSDAFRGYSVHLLLVDECIEYYSKITIKYKTLGITQSINIGDLYKKMTNRDFLIKELLKLNPVNEELVAEYVDFCLLNNTNKIKYETDVHHILPKSYFPEFKRDKNNLTNLTYKNHFLAHKLLALTFPHKSKIIFAFNAMKNKIQPFRKKEDLDNTITEEEFEKIRKNIIGHLKNINKGFVTARLKGESCNFYQIPKDEFIKNREKYETPSDDLITVFDKELGKKVRISKKEYKNNKERYKFHTLRYTFVNPKTKERIISEKNPDEKNFLFQNSEILVLRENKEIFIKVNKILENDIFLYTKDEFKKIQKQKKAEERQKQLEEKRKEKEFHKDEIRKEKQKKSKEKHIEKRKQMFQDEQAEYKKHTPLPSRKRKNDKILAYDKIENKNVAISKEVFYNNPDRYEGVNKNTIDVIELSTNKKMKIKKHFFDKTKYKRIPRTNKIFLVFNSYDELVFEGNLYETLDFLQSIEPSIKNCEKIHQAAGYEEHQRLQQPKRLRGWRIRLK